MDGFKGKDSGEFKEVEGRWGLVFCMSSISESKDPVLMLDLLIPGFAV